MYLCIYVSMWSEERSVRLKMIVDCLLHRLAYNRKAKTCMFWVSRVNMHLPLKRSWTGALKQLMALFLIYFRDYVHRLHFSETEMLWRRLLFTLFQQFALWREPSLLAWIGLEWYFRKLPGSIWCCSPSTFSAIVRSANLPPVEISSKRIPEFMLPLWVMTSRDALNVLKCNLTTQISPLNVPFSLPIYRITSTRSLSHDEKQSRWRKRNVFWSTEAYTCNGGDVL